MLQITVGVPRVTRVGSDRDDTYSDDPMDLSVPPIRQQRPKPKRSSLSKFLDSLLSREFLSLGQGHIKL